MSIAIVRTVADLRAQVAQWHREGLRVGMVPTMGALHDGHLTLVRRGRELADRVVASVFVNPTQFGPNEDFARYPRDEAGDGAKLASAGCDLLFAPTVDVMYPAGFATSIDVGPIATRWEGAFRPGHFQGVATVVTKLLSQGQADVACFGEKDFQQLAVIRQLVRDLDLPVAIEGVPTVREADGLALSSRNAYLSSEQRQVAGQLNRILRETIAAVCARPDTVEAACQQANAALLAAGFAAVDYLAMVDAATLEPLATLGSAPARIICTARIGGVRLLDNMPVA
ncbi:pantoate--beta-alanine ligase [Niveispirillum sp. SYP-B3756]|uniref:pantoate--beta-alanine ligase n=1 Tax=Niveispirillum sp. SYP-B3756 TaxID=2662178 RepID=UPI001290BA9C|nr:pantoate--beta-alanine ligase [Niveispirillum sp. SYP-B3756]MQP66655.1 pantoate--beta-alanine ligase [Niveispirillum sp. SYP-B3756]